MKSYEPIMSFGEDDAATYDDSSRGDEEAPVAFLEELARAACERGTQYTAMVIPDTVQAVLAARIDRLRPAEKRLLQTASVIGQEVSLPLLRAIAALPEEVLQQSLRALQHPEFLHETRAVPEPVYTFKHALTQ